MNKRLICAQRVSSKSLLILSSIAALACPCIAFTADFIQNSTCGLTNPAFMEKFSIAYPGGKGGDLDETKWTVARNTSERFGTNLLNGYSQADIPPCKSGYPALAYPDSEILVCDNSDPSKNGRLMTPMVGQYYGINSFRINQPFDFAGRTGTIAFDADGWGDMLNSWVGVSLTEDPIPGPNYYGEHNGVPRNGMILAFMNCSAGRPEVPIGFLYNNYVETQFSTTQCYSLKEGMMNHFELRISQNHIEVWASDTSQDGITFPNFKMIASVDNVNFPFTSGYITMHVNNHATFKYSHIRTATHYWDNIAFDGPVLPMTRVYSVPEAMTPTTDPGYPGPTSINLGWVLLDSAYNQDRGMYSCCPLTKIPPIVLKNVDLTNATKAMLSLNAWYSFIDVAAANPANVELQYRFNGGTWRDRFITADEIAVLQHQNPGVYAIPQIITVPLSDLKQGDNTLEILSKNNSLSSPTVIANIDLNIEFASGPTSLKSARQHEAAALWCEVDPRSSSVAMRIQVPSDQTVDLSLYNIAGQMIRYLAKSSRMSAGITSVLWDGKDAAGKKQAAGLYVVLLKTGHQVLKQRIMLSR
jgi:hypothetical protein